MPQHKKTFRYISNKYHISRTSLYKRIQKIPNFKKNYMTKIGNMWLVDDSGVKLINGKKKNSTSPFKPKRVKKVRNTSRSKHKEPQLTKRGLVIGVKNLRYDNKKLSDSIHELVNDINKLTNTNANLSNSNNNLQKTVNNLTNKLSSNRKQLKLTYNKINNKSNHNILWKLKNLFR